MHIFLIAFVIVIITIWIVDSDKKTQEQWTSKGYKDYGPKISIMGVTLTNNGSNAYYTPDKKFVYGRSIYQMGDQKSESDCYWIAPSICIEKDVFFNHLALLNSQASAEVARRPILTETPDQYAQVSRGLLDKIVQMRNLHKDSDQFKTLANSFFDDLIDLDDPLIGFYWARQALGSFHLPIHPDLIVNFEQFRSKYSDLIHGLKWHYKINRFKPKFTWDADFQRWRKVAVDLNKE